MAILSILLPVECVVYFDSLCWFASQCTTFSITHFCWMQRDICGQSRMSCCILLCLVFDVWLSRLNLVQPILTLSCSGISVQASIETITTYKSCSPCACSYHEIANAPALNNKVVFDLSLLKFDEQTLSIPEQFSSFHSLQWNFYIVNNGHLEHFTLLLSHWEVYFNMIRLK